MKKKFTWKIYHRSYMHTHIAVFNKTRSLAFRLIFLLHGISINFSIPERDTLLRSRITQMLITDVIVTHTEYLTSSLNS